MRDTKQPRYNAYTDIRLRKNFLIIDSIVVRVSACHAGDQGSIPRRGAIFS